MMELGGQGFAVDIVFLIAALAISGVTLVWRIHRLFAPHASSVSLSKSIVCSSA
jgi:hypothetical protein